ncbi:MAG: GntR family transcriptional regulator [Opitutaceae bacterium]|nr:GntR family transcriptional regulator [Opitutaceae bacterium]
MKHPRPPFEIPRRASLAATTAAAIRQGIAAGCWRDYLPTERRLEEMFQVSRPTLRVALHLLAAEQLVEIRPGQGTRLRHRQAQPARERNRLVVLISHQPVPELGVTYDGVSEMRTHLAKQGFDTATLLCRTTGPAAQRLVANYLRRNRVFCSVLLSVSEHIQRWFSTRGLPALVIGSCHPHVKLPSLDFDNRLICRHAAGVFLRRGHRRLALIVPDSGLAGDLVSEQGFLAAITDHRGRPRAEGRIVHHDGTAANLIARLDALLRSASPPTALLIANIEEVFIVLMHLIRRGLAVPDSVSFIARDHHRIFDTVVPAVAHYRPKAGAFEHRLSRLMLQMVGQGYLKPEPTLIVPSFVAGGTIQTLA